MVDTHPGSDDDSRIRRRAAWISLGVAIVLLAAKYEAYLLTGSKAVLSDALESIVNVVAAAFAIGGIAFSHLPADRNHPYGHGKIEFFSAAFEGGLIAFAALVILFEAVRSLLYGVELRQLDVGILITAGAGVANLGLGVFLERTGRRHHSVTLIADGKHVKTDFWTSVGVVVGLLMVRLTGLSWLDPAVACLFALWLLYAGWKLVRMAAGGLLDEEDPELLARLVDELDRHVGEGVISVHYLRAIRAGRYHHVSGHLVVPEFWSVERAHDVAERVAARVIRQLGIEGELDFHTDPCHRAYCSGCDLETCAVRAQSFQGHVALTVDAAVAPDRVPGH